MNKKILTLLFFILIICIISTLATGCDEPYTEETLPQLEIAIDNQSTSTLKHIYWISDTFSGVLDIDVPPDTEELIYIDMWPGEIFQFMITASDTDQYVKWTDVQSASGYFYLKTLNFHVELFVSCLLEAWFMEEDGLDNNLVYSVENTLPSMP